MVTLLHPTPTTLSISLRTLKEPGMHKEGFMDRWNAILHQCSQDLLILVMDTSSKMNTEFKLTPQENRDKYKHHLTSEKEQNLAKLDKDLKKFREELKSI